MRRLTLAEIVKLTTTRAIYLLFAAAIVIAVVTTLDPQHSAATFDKPFHELTFVFFGALLTRILILVLGIRMATDEFRYGTIVPSLLATPKRSRVLAAKAIAAAAAGIVIALVSWVAMATTASFIARSEGTSLVLDAGAWRALGGAVLAGALWGVIGVGLGAIIRNQVIAIVGGLVWLMGLEDVVKGLLGDAGGYLPGQAGLSLALAPGGRVFTVALATLLAYAAAVVVAGTQAMKRDVT
jgi:ABC-2 type transport system permease protein